MSRSRDDILQASARIFGEKGFHAASMQEIADAVDLQKGSLYHHVQSKQEILAALLEQALELLIADLRQVVAADLPPAGKLRRAVRAYLTRLADNAELARVLLFEYRSLEPDLLARHVARRDAYESLWRQIVTEGVEAGEFRELDVPVAGFALLGLQNWMITWYRPDGRLSASEVADRFVDLMLEGLGYEDSRP
jgi:AcrR family transcriptional regulator